MKEKEDHRSILCRFAAFVTAIVFMLAFSASAAAEEADTSYRLEADKLNALGLFKGTDIGYELDRSPNRAEAGVMLVRLLGKESKALSENYPHPFSDVPDWAASFVGYMWENGLTKGVGDGLYAPYEPIDARSYLTFLLRSLGYSDDSGEFTWEDAVGFSYRIGLITGREYDQLLESDFTRGLMVALSYDAMNFSMKGSDETLAAHLVAEGAVDEPTVSDLNFNLSIPEWKRYLRYLKAGYFKPYVIGLDVDTALIQLRKSGAKNIDIEYSFNDLVPEGNVISQDFTAYVDSSEEYDCSIEVSRGPFILYQAQLMNIAESKGWDETVAPYVIAASKFLINETVLTKYDVFRRLEDNLNDIVILDDEDSAKMSYGAVYEAYSGNMYVNGFILDQELILHELIHAMSYSKASGKVGFPKNGNNSRKITEAFTHYLAGKINGETAGQLITFNTGTETLEFSGGEYFGEGDNNFILGVFAPLFTLAGKQAIENMFFNDESRYGQEILDFNSRYGEQRFETLWSLADKFITDSGSMPSSERNELVGIYTDYLDQIIECLYIDLDAEGNSENDLLLLRSKVDEIKMEFPLDYNDYRNKFMQLENEISTRLEEYRPGQVYEKEGYWTVPDLVGVYSLETYNRLKILGDAAGIGYEVIESNIDSDKTAGVLLKSKDGSTELLRGGEQVELGSIYIIQIPMEVSESGDYMQMRDLVDDFGKYLVDYSDISSYIVAKVLQSEGLSFKYEFLYFDDASPEMNGRIVGQFPEPGTAVIPGKTTVIIKIIRKRQ